MIMVSNDYIDAPKLIDAELRPSSLRPGEAQQWQAESAARVSATQAESAVRISAMQADSTLKNASLIVVGAVGVLLRVDFAVHDVRALQRWRMLRRLRSLELPRTAFATPRVQLPTGVTGLRLGPKPTMLLGEKGSGKSMQLAQMARDAIAPAEGPPSPVAYIRMRQPKSGADGGGNGSGSFTSAGGGGSGEAVASARLEAIARQVFEQLGYPSRPSLISVFWAQLRHVQWQELDWQLHRGRVQRDRFVDALRIIFDVAERLYIERKAAGISEEYAPIVLLFDQVQDLIKDYRLANVGGRYVFEELAGLLVAYGVDRRAVRSAVAGSSAQLAVEFDKTVAHGPRWRYAQICDPSPETILPALGSMGYSAEQANLMVQLVGTRLRLLEVPLEYGAAVCSCKQFLKSSRDFCVASFTDLLDEPAVPSEARDALVGILQRIAAHEAGRGEAPTWHETPEPLRAQQFSKVLYMRLDRTLTFQSQLHRNVWHELSARYARHQLQ